MEFDSGNIWNMDISTKRNWIDSMIRPCLQTLPSTLQIEDDLPKQSSQNIGGSAYYELLRDNYRSWGGKWVKMNKEEAREYDNDLNISIIFALDTDDDIDEFEYNEDGYAIFPF